MKRRGWRVVLTVVTVGLALVASLVAFKWPTVRDHAEAWWFQVARKTETIEPAPALKESPREFMHAVEQEVTLIDMRGCFLVLATYSGLKVIFDSAEDENSAFPRTTDFHSFWILPRGSDLTAASALDVLRENGWRVLEQRFPRRAYVVIRDEQARREASP
jgi:hypothetical protein